MSEEEEVEVEIVPTAPAVKPEDDYPTPIAVNTDLTLKERLFGDSENE